MYDEKYKGSYTVRAFNNYCRDASDQKYNESKMD